MATGVSRGHQPPSTQRRTLKYPPGNIAQHAARIRNIPPDQR